MDLNPAGRVHHIPVVVASSPALNKADAKETHLGQCMHSLVAVLDRLIEKLGELLCVKNINTAA